VRRRAVVLVVLLALAGLAGATALRAQEPGLATKTFTARYKGVDEIVALIQPVVSDRGTYAVQPRIKSVTVTDTPDRIRRMEALIADFDVPPRGIHLVFQLMRAEEGKPAAQDPAPRRRMGLPPAVIQDLTKWGVITQIGSASIATAEMEGGALAMGAEHRVRFSMGSVSADLGVIRMDRFVLEKVGRDDAGGEGARPLMDLVLNLKDGRTTVLGATGSQDSKQALFVSITATLDEQEEP